MTIDLSIIDRNIPPAWKRTKTPDGTEYFLVAIGRAPHGVQNIAKVKKEYDGWRIYDLINGLEFCGEKTLAEAKGYASHRISKLYYRSMADTLRDNVAKWDAKRAEFDPLIKQLGTAKNDDEFLAIMKKVKISGADSVVFDYIIDAWSFC